MGQVVGFPGVIEDLISIRFGNVINKLAPVHTLIICLRLVQGVLGNHIFSIVILNERLIFPILLVVYHALSIGYICLCSGDSQLGIRNCFRGSHLIQGQLGALNLQLNPRKGGLEGLAVAQTSQHLPGLHLLAFVDQHFTDSPRNDK